MTVCYTPTQKYITVRDIDKYNKACLLRKKGYSYSKIGRLLDVPKSTLSGWFSKSSWSHKISIANNTRSLESNKKHLQKFNLKRSSERELRHKRYIAEAISEYKELSKNKLFLIGTALYWGEGDKANTSRVSIVNSDIEMLKIMKSYYVECLHVETSKLRIGLFIYENMNETEIRKYWSLGLGIPINQFIKTQVLPSRSKLTRKKLKYGICSLYFSNTELHIKILQWMKMLSQNVRE